MTRVGGLNKINVENTVLHIIITDMKTECIYHSFIFNYICSSKNWIIQRFALMFNPLLLNPPQTALNQWFLNLLPNQAWAAELLETGWQAEDNYEHI